MYTGIGNDSTASYIYGLNMTSVCTPTSHVPLCPSDILPDVQSTSGCSHWMATRWKSNDKEINLKHNFPTASKMRAVPSKEV